MALVVVQGGPVGKSVFVDAEAPFAGSALVRNAREGLSVVLVYPDGVEKIIEATSPTDEAAGVVATARRLAGKSRAPRSGQRLR